MIELVEVAPNCWRVKREQLGPARSTLPMPHVISDEMSPTEHVDGNFYTSKARFRAVGRALGLTEVGNEKFKPKWRSTDLKQTKQERRQTLRTAVEKFRAGHRAGGRRA